MPYLRLRCEKNIRISKRQGVSGKKRNSKKRKLFWKRGSGKRSESGPTRRETARLSKSGKFLSKQGEVVGGWSRKRITKSTGRGRWKISVSWQRARKKVRSKISPDEKRAWTFTEPTGQQSTIS